LEKLSAEKIKICIKHFTEFITRIHTPEQTFARILQTVAPVVFFKGNVLKRTIFAHLEQTRSKGKKICMNWSSQWHLGNPTAKQSWH